MSAFGSPHYTARGVAHLKGMTSLEELNFHGALATDDVLVATDVRKESSAELAASGLSWSDVDKAVQARAREWFRTSEVTS